MATALKVYLAEAVPPYLSLCFTVCGKTEHFPICYAATVTAVADAAVTNTEQIKGLLDATPLTYLSERYLYIAETVLASQISPASISFNTSSKSTNSQLRNSPSSSFCPTNS